MNDELQKRLMRLSEADAVMLAKVTPSIARLLTAVRAALDCFDVDADGVVSPLEALDHDRELAVAIRELQSAFDALNPDE